MAGERAHWGSRVGFVLAATGSAVGLGNVWKFPYIAGANGGGLFVLVYLAAVALVGVPILMAEILIGRTAQASPVGAFRRLSGGAGLWQSFGWLGVASALGILSYYGVVAGWCLEYARLSVTGELLRSVGTAAEASSLFGALVSDGPRNVLLQGAFIALTVGIVIGGVRGGVERASRVLMPMLFVLLLGLFLSATTLDGFGAAFRFVFAPDASRLRPAGVLEALGHSFFTLSVGMGAMLTYGSYLRRGDSLVGPSIAVGVLDTLVALVACLVIFPVTFTYGQEPAGGAGLVFMSLPVALARLPAGALVASAFFVLLAFAALTSAISLLEVGAAWLMEERRFSRRAATLATGVFVFLLGIPSALSGSGFFAEVLGRSWFDWFDYVTSNWFLPISGFGIAIFVAWKVDVRAAGEAFAAGSSLGRAGWFFAGWLQLLRYVVPAAIVAIFLHSIGVF